MIVWGRKLQTCSGVIFVLLFISNIVVTLVTTRLIHSNHAIDFQPRTVNVPNFVIVWIQWTLLIASVLLILGRILALRRSRREQIMPIHPMSSMDLWIVFGWVSFWFFVGAFGFAVINRVHSILLPPDVSLILAALRPVWLQITAIIVIPMYFRGRLHVIGLGRVETWRRLIIAVLASSALLLAIGEAALWLTSLAQVATASYRENTIADAFQNAKHVGYSALALQMAVTSIIAPIGEELIFRGVLQTYLVKRMPPGLGIDLSALCFTLFHADIDLTLPLFLVGIVLGATYRWTGRLYSSMVVHMVNNALASLANL